MNIQNIIRDKKEWRVHVARVKELPSDYQIVYKEVQNYIFKVGPIKFSDEIKLLSGIVDLFEEGVANGKNVLEITGKDVAGFCDELIDDTKTWATDWNEKISRDIKKKLNKS
jgi:DNA-binding ferritin-like protein (Dps family)